MTSVIELSTSIGPSSTLGNIAPAADATLDDIEAALVATRAAKTQCPSAEGMTQFRMRSIADKLRICQEETSAAATRMLQVMPASVFTAAPTGKVMETGRIAFE